MLNRFQIPITRAIRLISLISTIGVFILCEARAVNETRSNQSRRQIGVLQASPEQAPALKAAGVELTVLSVSWDRFEPVKDQPDSDYIKQLHADLNAFRAAGMSVVLDLGIQYPPAWIFEIPYSRYQNQFNQLYEDRSPGKNVANAVFNAAIRARQARYMENVFKALGTDFFAVRLGGGWFGELNYPSATFAGKTNCYWAFDSIAQGKTSGLANGLGSCPVPNWKPGSASTDAASARLFANWYLDCLKNYHDWQITTARRHFRGRLFMLYPSWGLRPGQLNAAIAGNLSGRTPPERNGELSRGFDFARFIGGITDAQVWIYSTWADSNPDWSDERSADQARWSPAHFLSALARQHRPALSFAAENTGGGGFVAMKLCGERIHELDIPVFFWAFAPDLFDHVAPEVQDLRPSLTQ